MLTGKEGLIRDVKVKGNLGCSDHEMVYFRLRGRSRTKSKTTVLGFRRANFSLLRDLLDIGQREKGLEGRGAQGSWLMAQE